jgi:hypothetical protein
MNDSLAHAPAHQPLASSSVESVAYGEDTGILEVVFRNRSRYRYFEVPLEVYRGLLAADSSGRYFNRFIRGEFRFERRPWPSPSV